MFQYIKYLGTCCFFSFNLYKILKIIITHLVLNKHCVAYLLKIKLELQKSFVRSSTKNRIEQRCNPKYSLVYFYDQLPLSSYINHFFSLGFFLQQIKLKIEAETQMLILKPFIIYSFGSIYRYFYNNTAEQNILVVNFNIYIYIFSFIKIHVYKISQLKHLITGYNQHLKCSTPISTHQQIYC